MGPFALLCFGLFRSFALLLGRRPVGGVCGASDPP